MKNEYTSTQGPVIDFSSPLDYSRLISHIETLSSRYPELETGYIGATILDNAIPVLSLGNPRASKSIIYIGGIGAGDYITSAVLLRFVNDYFEFLKNSRRIYSVNLPYLFEHRRICVIPMLNCDGCTINLNGCGESILKDRLLSMNEKEQSFSSWQSNARGVDLRHNFSAGFSNAKIESQKNGIDYGCGEGYFGTSPESEPETASLCNYIRMYNGISLLINLHMGDNTLSFSSAENIARSRTLGRLISRMGGVTMRGSDTVQGTVHDWYSSELHQPAFSLGCGYTSANLNGSPEDYLKIYAFVREILFSAPLLV